MSDVPTVHERMAAVVRALSHIPKQTSQGVSYEFRGIDAVMGALHGPLADNGLYLSPRILDDWQVNPIPGTNNRTQYQSLFRVCVDVYAEDGSTVTLGPGLAQSHDYGDKAVYQAQQNAIKYLLLEAFCIPTSEQDMDARTPDPSPTVDLTAVNAAIGDALAAGLEVDADKVRAHAQQGAEQAEQAERVLRDRIAEHQKSSASGADRSGGDDGSEQASTSSPPDTSWRQVMERAGVDEVELLMAVQRRWSNTDQSAKPKRTKDLDAAAARAPDLVMECIGELEDEKRGANV